MDGLGPSGTSVALVGFMGAGKSAVGSALASVLGVAFVDTDDLVTETAGPIPKVFAERGEAGFRAVEREVVLRAVDDACRRRLVLALGGGAVLAEDVREALRRLPHVVWLTAPTDVLWSRVRGGGRGSRPLANDEQGFLRLLHEREALYREVATVVADNDGSQAAADLADDLAGRLRGVAAPTERRAAGGPAR